MNEPGRPSLRRDVAADELERRVAERTAQLTRANALLREELAERNCTEPLLLGKDVTDRQRAETAFRESTSFWRAILDSAAYSIIATTPDGIVREFNLAAERMLGYGASEVVGKATMALVHDPGEIAARAARLSPGLDGEIPALFETLVAKASRGGSDESEWTYVRKDGTRFPVRLSVTALRAPNGVISGFLGIASDITADNRARAELTRAKEAAEQSMRARTDFLARMSHEIRTPMNGVLGMTSLALTTALDPEAREYIETARTSAKSLLAIINEILDFSKIDAGDLRLEAIPFRPRELCTAAVQAQMTQARLKDLDLAFEVAADVPESVVGDPQRLNQVLGHLIGNAIKFTDRGQVILGVDVREVVDGRVTLAVHVTDTGVGIPGEKQAHVFEAFAQADEAPTRRFGGTGLGLAICAQLVGLMGGKVSVESEPDRGSRFGFTVTLAIATSGLPAGPMHATAVSSAPTAEALASPATETPSRTAAQPRPKADDQTAPGGSIPSGRALRVLVAEDNPVNRTLARRLLERAGHAVVAVENGRRALLALAQARFDVVLMDVQMPEMDGLEAVRVLRAAERSSGEHVPVIALTAQAMSGDREVCLEAGMDAYVSKPLDVHELLAAIEALTAAPIAAPEPSS